MAAANKPAAPGKRKEPGLLGDLDRAIAAADWLQISDAAAVELARILARQILAGEVSPQIVGRFMDTLRDLGLTVQSRKALALGIKESTDDKLAEIRAIKPAALRIANSAAGVTQPQ